MLEAKYVNVFSRTGTQPFLFTCHLGDKLGAEIQESACNLQPTGIRPASEQYYLADRKILSSPNCRHPYLCQDSWDLANFSTLWMILGKQFLHPRSTKNSKKFKAGNADSRKGFRWVPFARQSI